MSLSRLNSSAATLTKNRTDGSVVPASGMCVTCVDGCIGMCEIGKSAYRGHEVIYPQPFGVITTAAEKNYPVDYSHFNIMGTAVGAHGIAADSDKAIFPAVNLEVALGHDRGIQFRYPWIISGHRLDEYRQEQLGRPGRRFGAGRHRPHHRRERRRHGSRGGNPERQGGGHGGPETTGRPLPASTSATATAPSSCRRTSKIAAWARRSMPSRSWAWSAWS